MFLSTGLKVSGGKVSLASAGRKTNRNSTLRTSMCVYVCIYAFIEQ